MNFVFQKKIQYESRFCLRKKQFLGRKYGPKLKQIRSKSLAQTPRSLPLFGYVLYIFPISAFLSKYPTGKTIEYISTKIEQKKQIFGRNCCENRTKIKHKKQKIWWKMLRKSHFLKKKHFLIFARFS